jgi:hypothetical protein
MGGFQLYLRKRCTKKFTPPVDKHHTTPLQVITYALSLYNRLFTQKEAGKRTAKEEKSIEQLMIYSLALSKCSGIRFYHFKCAWLDDHEYYEIYLLHVVYKKCRSQD